MGTLIYDDVPIFQSISKQLRKKRKLFKFLKIKKKLFFCILLLLTEKQTKASETQTRIMLSTLNCETNQEDTNTNPHLSYLVQPRLHGQRQRLPSLKVLWINIVD